MKKEKDINKRNKTFITALGKYYFEKYIKPQLKRTYKDSQDFRREGEINDRQRC